MYGTLHADAMRRLAGERCASLQQRARIESEVRRTAAAGAARYPTPRIVVTLSLGRPWVAVRPVRFRG